MFSENSGQEDSNATIFGTVSVSAAEQSSFENLSTGWVWYYDMRATAVEETAWGRKSLEHHS